MPSRLDSVPAKKFAVFCTVLDFVAAPTTAMTHIAIQENLDGKVVEWLEKVSDEQYQA
jgi:hypothetical protein